MASPGCGEAFRLPSTSPALTPGVRMRPPYPCPHPSGFRTGHGSTSAGVGGSGLVPEGDARPLCYSPFGMGWRGERGAASSPVSLRSQISSPSPFPGEGTGGSAARPRRGCGLGSREKGGQTPLGSLFLGL